jgi:hypothetical protein
MLPDFKPRCYVYFMETHDSLFVKIGHSVNVMRRFHQLSEASPGLRLLNYFAAPESHEYELHRKFADCHFRGEWFRKTAQLTAFIASLPQINPLPDIGPTTYRGHIRKHGRRTFVDFWQARQWFSAHSAAECCVVIGPLKEHVTMYR